MPGHNPFQDGLRKVSDAAFT